MLGTVRPPTIGFVMQHFLIGLIVLLLMLACWFSDSPQNPTNITPLPRSTTAIQRQFSNPFGLMLGAPGMALEQRVLLAKELGVTYFRPNTVRIDAWDGTCEECEAAQQSGLKLILTVSNTGGTGQPSEPPTDLTAYARTLEAILNQYHPEVLVIENEENSSLFYRGSPEQYKAQLQAACAVAHAYGIRCANGGLVSTLVALLVYDAYMENGSLAQAQSFAERAFEPEVRSQLDSPQARKQIQKGKALLQAYSAAGVDYINFHWYISEPTALAEAVQFLRNQSGLPVMTNEIGQQDLSPATVTDLMSEVVRLELPFAVWFSIDAAKARALMNPDGTLRESGLAFQQFIRSLPSSP